MNMYLCTDLMQNDIQYLERRGMDTSIQSYVLCSMQYKIYKNICQLRLVKIL
ncbi:hypothetical protein WN48_02398 [Eufriesea mexicana]|nr:hypothetical protein WN48_02398 [Eufriesea mexicana]